jgi:hypothetical protein
LGRADRLRQSYGGSKRPRARADALRHVRAAALWRFAWVADAFDAPTPVRPGTLDGAVELARARFDSFVKPFTS